MLMKTPVVGPDTLVEKIFSCFLVLLGAFVFAVLLGNITAMIAVFDRKNAMFRDRVGEIDRFAATRSLPNSLHKKVLRHFREHWSLTIGLEGVPVPPEVVAALEPGGVSSPPSPPSPTDDLERLHREVLSVGAA